MLTCGCLDPDVGAGKVQVLLRAKTLFNKFKDGDPGLPTWEEPEGKEEEEPQGEEEEEEAGNEGVEQQEAEPRKEAEEGGRGGG